MLALANVYQLTDDLDACQHQLMTLLTGDKDNDPATIVSDLPWPVYAFSDDLHRRC